MQENIDRLIACGLTHSEAVVIANDFKRENDPAGFAAYLLEIETIHAEAEQYHVGILQS